MPIFDFNDFEYRNVLKLAPDAFITINGSLGAKIVSPLKDGKSQILRAQGGITSISVNNSLQTGSGKANIKVIAPKYKGLHEDYYVTLPSGVRIPYFLPMMEVKIYMKGRYTKYNYDRPTYYPVFWGLITGISEDYSDGVYSFSLNCSDILTWWKYQKITTNPSVFTTIFGGPKIENFPTVFKNKNPWQIIMQLVYDTGWISRDGTARYNFVFPTLSNIKIPPDLGGLPLSVIGALADEVNDYWIDRFSFKGERVPLEMFGITQQITNTGLETLKYMNLQGVDLRSPRYNERTPADISLDYNLLARVQPFGDITLFGDGAQPTEMTKHDIAVKVCDLTHMEFFLDMNGTLVFKPPFYNMDVTEANVPFYNIGSSDVISFNSSVNSEGICNFLELTAPQSQQIRDLDITGFHIDWELMVRYGMRHQKSFVQWGNDSKTLRLIAAAEMARINGLATTGSVSIPLRPELRLGYPVYLEHNDEYWYVSGISHSFSYGTSATTDLSLEIKRDRKYDPTGEIAAKSPANISSSETQLKDNSNIGRVLKGYVWRFRETSEIEASLEYDQQGKGKARKKALELNLLDDGTYVTELESKEKYKRVTEVLTGPKFNGFYELSKARVSSNQIVQDTTLTNESGAKSSIVSNELLMITSDTVPYTDKNGYRHIGAFPYGANLRLINDVDLVNESNVEEQFNNSIRQMIDDEEERTLPRKTKEAEPFKATPDDLDNQQDNFDGNFRDVIEDPNV